MTNERDIAMFKSVIRMGQNTLKAALVLNVVLAAGSIFLLGQIVGCVTGSEVTPAVVIDLAALLASLRLFGCGAIAAAVAFGVSYIAQYLYALNLDRYAYPVHAVVLLLVLVGYLAFIAGMYSICGVFVH